jgi:hypothetical protein
MTVDVQAVTGHPWEVLWRSIYIIKAMMEAVRNSETSVHFNVTTRRYIPED